MRKLTSIVILLVLWQLLIIMFGHNALLPSPLEIINAFNESYQRGHILIHILTSLQRVSAGFMLASFVGITLALALGYFEKIGSYIEPIIELFRPVPPIAWIPIAILLFGLGNASAYFIVFLGAFFPIFTNTYFGAMSLPKIYINISRSFEVSRVIFLRKILFYFCLPYIFAGLKIGMGMAWMSVIAAELIGAQSGLGYFIQINRLLLRTDNIVLGMILIGLIGYVLVRIITYVEYRSMPWLQKKYD